ncbi:MAG: phosphotriesterase-related protein, partial [Brevibacterium yomogidense]
MAAVETVKGSIDSAQLGRTYAHEHVFVLGEEHRLNYQEWDEEAMIDLAVRDLNELKGLGIDSIMDPTVLGLGRYIPRIQRIAERTDLN